MTGPLVVENYRGRPVPRSLGIVLAGCAWTATFAWALLRGAGPAAWGALAGCLLVFAAGLVDDLVQDGPRGLREHLRSLAAGRVTTGLAKMIAAVGASAVVIALEPSEPWWTALTGIVLVAAATNVWNGLDVRPGRALKAFLPVGAAFVLFTDAALAPAVVGVTVGAVVALAYDLTERAMLGDAGANLLGFSAGLGLYLVLAPWAVPLAALAAVALNLLAETVTLSRAIDAAPPLRWIDELGRLRESGR